jgi:hypothetical protein
MKVIISHLIQVTICRTRGNKEFLCGVLIACRTLSLFFSSSFGLRLNHLIRGKCARTLNTFVLMDRKL